MATDLTLYLDDHPGELARLGTVLGRAGVNIEGFCATTSGGGRAEVHILVGELADALTDLAAAGFRVASEQEVLVVPVEDRPGVLGDVARRLGDGGINVSLAYLATSTRLVLAADDLGAARQALS